MAYTRPQLAVEGQAITRVCSYFTVDLLIGISARLNLISVYKAKGGREAIF